MCVGSLARRMEHLMDTRNNSIAIFIITFCYYIALAVVLQISQFSL